MEMGVDWVRVYAPEDVTSIEEIQSIKIEECPEVDTDTFKMLQYTIEPENVGNRALTWQSSDDSIASAYGGVLRIKQTGTIDVTVTTANGKSDTITINIVEPSQCTSIALDQSTLTIDATTSTTATLTATIEPSDCTQEITWSTDNAKIATVNGGVVTAVRNGTCTITATCGEQSATCDVTVTGITSDVISVQVALGTFDGSNNEAASTTRCRTAMIEIDSSEDGITMNCSRTDINFVILTANEDGSASGDLYFHANSSDANGWYIEPNSVYSGGWIVPNGSDFTLTPGSNVTELPTRFRFLIRLASNGTININSFDGTTFTINGKTYELTI